MIGDTHNATYTNLGSSRAYPRLLGEEMTTHGWIGVDLDGTLAHYEGWKGINHIGDPIPAMLERVKNWIDEGKTVKIFTARVCQEFKDDKSITKIIQDWCEFHIGVRLEVTCKKDWGMIELWDDRCVQVELNTGKLKVNV